MGAIQPETTLCYSGMIYFDDLTPFYNKPAGVDIILKECQFDYDLGYRQFKLKIGRGNLIDVHLTDIQDMGFTGWRKLMPELKKLK